MCCITLCVGVFRAHAATIYFDPQETTVGTKSPFIVGVNINSDAYVNAIKLVIDLPVGLDVLDASDGDSILNLWIERPHINDKRQIVLAGIIPGGFQGTGGRLLSLTVKADKVGSYSLRIDPESSIFVNTGDMNSEPIISKPLHLSVQKGRDNIMNAIPDRTAPESFQPSLISVADGSRIQQALAFATQDKGVGLDRYQVAESHLNIALYEQDKISNLSWTITESPYVLHDQDLSSYVYVQAIDKNGNARTAVVYPKYPQMWYERPEGYIIIVLSIVILAYALYHFTHTRRHLQKRTH